MTTVIAMLPIAAALIFLAVRTDLASRAALRRLKLAGLGISLGSTQPHSPPSEAGPVDPRGSGNLLPFPGRR